MERALSSESYPGRSAGCVTWGNLLNLSEPQLPLPRKKIRTPALMRVSSGFEKITNCFQVQGGLWAGVSSTDLKGDSRDRHPGAGVCFPV